MSYSYLGNHQGDWTASASYRARDTVINNNALYRALAPHTAGGSFSSDSAFWTKLSVTTEEIEDLVGAMVTGNSETGITVTYDDTNGKLDFSVSGGGGYTQEEIEDFVGAMVTGNTETNITVTYDDASGKLNFVASAASQEEIEDYVGAMVTGNTETGITVTYDDSGGKLNFAVATQLTTEDVQDIVGGMVTGNTETNMTVTYQDGDGTLDFSATILDQEQTINTQTGDYTFVLGDAYSLVELNSGSDHVFTVPPNSSVAFPAGCRIDVAQYGAGLLTIAQGSGVTIHSTGTLELAARYSGASLVQRATDEWYLFGDLGV